MKEEIKEIEDYIKKVEIDFKDVLRSYLTWESFNLSIKDTRHIISDNCLDDVFEHLMRCLLLNVHNGLFRMFEKNLSKRSDKNHFLAIINSLKTLPKYENNKIVLKIINLYKINIEDSQHVNGERYNENSYKKSEAFSRLKDNRHNNIAHNLNIVVSKMCLKDYETLLNFAEEILINLQCIIQNIPSDVNLYQDIKKKFSSKAEEFTKLWVK